MKLLPFCAAFHIIIDYVRQENICFHWWFWQHLYGRNADLVIEGAVDDNEDDDVDDDYDDDDYDYANDDDAYLARDRGSRW